MRTSLTSLVALSVFLLLIYSNSLNVPWQLDDSPNITTNYALHLDNLLPETLWRTFFAFPFSEGQLYRPIANLSIALNWYFGHDNPLGYHIVNLVIHILTAIFIFKSSLLLLTSHLTERFSDKDIHFIALLSTLLWAASPIQTQAVTYIVQRMASMAAMFYCLALYSFIKVRLAQTTFQIAAYSIACGLFFLLAMGCKENAITLVPSLFLIEALFFYKKNDKKSKYSLLFLSLTNGLIVVASLDYMIGQGYWHALWVPIGSRPFSPGERLLTEPSILLFYLSLLLYPSPDRLSIDHSFSLSTSLFQPWTTLPAILCVIALIAFAIWRWKKNPLLSFAILFFFINHLVESTIIPLELVFEHRNYLPSFFLFLPIAAGIRLFLNYSSSSIPIAYYLTLALIPTLLISIGIGTYTRNSVWTTEESLWSDALSKAPNNARPFAKLGEIYGWHKEKTPENLQTAVALLRKSLDLETPRTSFKAAIVGNIGKVYRLYGLHEEAVRYYRQSLQLNPEFINSRLDLAETLTLQGEFKDALQEINLVIKKSDLQSRFFNLKGLILLWLDRPQESAEAFHQALLRTFVNKERYFYNIGVAFTRSGHYSQGRWFLKNALKAYPDDRRILYSLIENHQLAENPISSRKYALDLISAHSLKSIQNDLQQLATDHSSAPIDTAFISPVIMTVSQDTASRLTPISAQKD